ncbi:arylsulfatase G-like [Artemia franciscana]|uniref:arylsulfatase G-like n=1 Tax=Artemia franciscana TaxID=6661 RepID=UPI0032DBD358
MGCVDRTGSDLPSCGPCGTIDENIPMSGPPCFPDIALPLVGNETVLEQPTDLYSLSEKYVEHATEIITKSSKPYFLYMALSQPHTPLTPSKKFEGKSERGIYGDVLLEMDWIVGQVTAAVKKSNNSNTLIWFMSDNGPWASKCLFGGSVGPFIGSWQSNVGGGGSVAKGTVWEGGHRVPSIVYWPGVVEAGSTSHELTSSLDILPTLANIGRINYTSKRTIDGIDISHIFYGGEVPEDRVLFHPNSGAFGNYGDVGAVRMGKYKAVFYSGGYPDCQGNLGQNQFHNPPLLFNLEEDIEEKLPLNTNNGKSEAGKALKKILKYYAHFYEKLQEGGISNTTYEVDWSLRPCCNPNDEFCRCDNHWKEL